MRMWHIGIIPYLPNMQLKGQLRELIAIMHNWRDKGYPQHLLVNNITNYYKYNKNIIKYSIHKMDTV